MNRVQRQLFLAMTADIESIEQRQLLWMKECDRRLNPRPRWWLQFVHRELAVARLRRERLMEQAERVS